MTLYAGQTISIQVALTIEKYYACMLFDDFSILQTAEDGEPQVPEPATMLLLGSGLLGLIGFGRKRMFG